jgi:hypothetical protein
MGRRAALCFLFVGVIVGGVFIIFAMAGWRAPDMRPDEKFEFQFGRGSGWHGLDVVRITSDGSASYEYQSESDVWRRKVFEIDADVLEALREKINSVNVMDMQRSYSNPSIADGTQWCLLVRIDGRTKSVYFNNKFPDEIRNLAAFVDETILEPFADPVDAVTVPSWHHRKHETPLWTSIR